jgi:hypothetical protein
VNLGRHAEEHRLLPSHLESELHRAQLGWLNALANPGLANGVTQTRFAKGSVYAISKKNSAENREYVVAFNNGLKPQSVEIKTATSTGGWKALLGQSSYRAIGATLKITVPALSTVVLKANNLIDTTSVKPGKISVALDDMTGYYQATAIAASSDLLSVEFFEKSSTNSTWSSLGSDTNAPYSVFLNPTEFGGQDLEIKAVATNSKGQTFTLPSSRISIPTP